MEAMPPFRPAQTPAYNVYDHPESEEAAIPDTTNRKPGLEPGRERVYYGAAESYERGTQNQAVMEERLYLLGGVME
jgi:hypothetical protein